MTATATVTPATATAAAATATGWLWQRTAYSRIVATTIGDGFGGWA